MTPPDLACVIGLSGVKAGCKIVATLVPYSTPRIQPTVIDVSGCYNGKNLDSIPDDQTTVIAGSNPGTP
jgi:hypothetical protein